MPFGTISVGTDQYEPRQPGYYSKSTVAFGDPANEFRVRGAGAPSKDGLLRASITRVLEKDISSGGVTARKPCVVTMTIAVPVTGFTASEVDALAADTSTFVSAATITRLLQGES